MILIAPDLLQSSVGGLGDFTFGINNLTGSS
jgi:hypothetical protein